MARRSHTDREADLRRELGYVTEREMANFLRIELFSLRNRINAGSVPPHYKVGREKFFRRDEVDEWIRRHRRGNGTA